MINSTTNSSSNIAKPDVLQLPEYKTLVAENVAILQQLIPDYQPLASDNYMLLIEAFAYRELHLHQLFNNKLMDLFPQFATHNNLDSCAQRYGVTRLSNEEDEAFRARILKSLDGFSTAGSIESYEFHAYSVSSVIDSAKAYSPNKGDVVVALASFKDESKSLIITPELIAQVNEKLHRPKIRPVTANVTVVKAKDKKVIITAQVFVFDLNTETQVRALITRNLKRLFKIGQTLTYSQLVRYLHADGVFKVNITSHNNDITCATDEILRINTVNLSFKAASEAM